MRRITCKPVAGIHIVTRAPMLAALAAVLLLAGCTSQDDKWDLRAAHALNPAWPEAGEPYAPLERRAAEKRLRRKMNKKTSVDFDQTPLTVAIERIRAETNANIVVVWGALKTAGIEQDLKIDLTLNDVAARTVLSLICDQAVNISGGYESVDFRVGPEYVLVTTERNLQVSARVTAAYPIENLIREMTRPIPTAPLIPAVGPRPETDAAASAGPAGLYFSSGDDDDEDDGTITRDEAINQIATLVRVHVGNMSDWAANGGAVASLRETHAHLWVRAPRHYHHELTELLAKLRGAQVRQLAAQLRDNEVMMLLQRAELHRLRGEYDAALRLVNLAGNVDPHHPLARAMRETLRQTRSNMQSGAASGSAATQPN